ncbi:MAG TPA: hypothetical protein VMT00_04525 [Thermoanaerobaculia bacterium]|nr:hypothetical protein [Thermoanaerobaculia bacterium]
MTRPNPSEIYLLPGALDATAVSPEPCIDARAIIRSARRRAFLQDLVDVSLLTAIDIAFITWKSARLPFFTREDTLAILLLLHVVIFGYILLVRKMPALRARFIASSWRPEERQHLRCIR